MNTFLRKGVITFIKAANFFPERLFVVVGKISKEMQTTILPNLMKNYSLNSSIPSNVTFTGFISGQKLLQWYGKSKVYCQLVCLRDYLIVCVKLCCVSAYLWDFRKWYS